MKIFISDISYLFEQEAFDAAYALVPAWRRRKVDEMKHQTGKCLALGAGVLLHGALQEMGLTEPQEAELNEYGKPFYREYPDVYFSISHSGTKVMCVISDAPVGCDVEQIKKRDQDIAKRFFASEEYQLIQSQPSEEEKTNMFFRIWTLKESFIKCIGTGLSTELNSFSIIPATETITIEQFVDETADFNFQEIEMNDGYRYAVCAKSY